MKNNILYYDIKNEMAEALLEDVKQKHQKDLLSFDIPERWEDATEVEKIIMYWYSRRGYESKYGKVKIFDCDSSDYAMEKYLSKYEWLNDYVIKGIWGRIFLINKYSNEIRLSGETLTSAWVPMKVFANNILGATIKSKDAAGYRDWINLEKKHKKLLEDCGIIRFLQAVHTEGNMMPVPIGFNAGRASGTYALHDQWDLSLQYIYNFYQDWQEEMSQISKKDFLEKHERFLTGSLWLMFAGTQAYDESYFSKVKIIAGWLCEFGSWEKFVKANHMFSFLEGYDKAKVKDLKDNASRKYLDMLSGQPPKPFFDGHFSFETIVDHGKKLGYNLPGDNLGHWADFFNNCSESIEERNRLLSNL